MNTQRTPKITRRMVERLVSESLIVRPIFRYAILAQLADKLGLQSSNLGDVWSKSNESGSEKLLGRFPSLCDFGEEKIQFCKASYGSVWSSKEFSR